jgi:hypothetical protein
MVAVFSGCLPPALGKSPPLRFGWLLFSSDCTLFALFCFFFCVAIIIIVCAPNPIFLSFFTLFLAACWLSLIPRLQTSGGSRPQVAPDLRRPHSLSPVISGAPPRSCSSALVLLDPFLGGPRILPRLGAPPRLLAFTSVLHTKPLALVRSLRLVLLSPAVLEFGLALVLLLGSLLSLEPPASPSEGLSSLPSTMPSQLPSSKPSNDPSSAP